MFFSHKILIFHCLGIGLAVTYVTSEGSHESTTPYNEEQLNRQIDEENSKYDAYERRFMDELSREEWHVAHLRPTDFETTRRAGCKEDTFEDKVKKYRKSLRNDAGRIKYVHAERLPVNDKDLEPPLCLPEDKLEVTYSNTTTNSTDKAIAKNNTNIDADKSVLNKTTINNTTANASTTATSNKSTAKGVEETKVTLYHDEKHSKSTATLRRSENAEIVNQATTPKVKGKGKGKRRKKNGAKRRSEYAFSSVEYDEDVADFKYADCSGGLLEIIELEIDNIRNYDVECELMLEWRSLS